MEPSDALPPAKMPTSHENSRAASPAGRSTTSRRSMPCTSVAPRCRLVSDTASSAFCGMIGVLCQPCSSAASAAPGDAADGWSPSPGWKPCASIVKQATDTASGAALIAVTGTLTLCVAGAIGLNSQFSVTLQPGAQVPSVGPTSSSARCLHHHMCPSQRRQWGESTAHTVNCGRVDGTLACAS